MPKWTDFFGGSLVKFLAVNAGAGAVALVATAYGAPVAVAAVAAAVGVTALNSYIWVGVSGVFHQNETDLILIREHEPDFGERIGYAAIASKLLWGSRALNVVGSFAATANASLVISHSKTGDDNLQTPTQSLTLSLVSLAATSFGFLAWVVLGNASGASISPKRKECVEINIRKAMVVNRTPVRTLAPVESAERARAARRVTFSDAEQQMEELNKAENDEGDSSPDDIASSPGRGASSPSSGAIAVPT